MCPISVFWSPRGEYSGLLLSWRKPSFPTPQCDSNGLGFGTGAYAAKLLAGTKQRLSGLSQTRQCGDDVFLMLEPKAASSRRRWDAQRIVTISRSVPA